jgi:hypothetical protein
MNWTEFATDPARVAAFERGIKKMKERSERNPLDPLGMIYQANIHDTTDTVPDDPSIRREWLGCRQAHGTREFLDWHRGYVYYFERILRHESGDETLNLPYWGWDARDQRKLPAEFRDKRNHPDLFIDDGDRSAAMNSGAEMPRDIDPANALLVRNFWPTAIAPGFSRRLENPPHDGVHGLVGGRGGLMGSTTTAARDPIFWVHHCNIDRLWDIWLADPSHRDPSDAEWLDKRFFYRDADGTSVEKRGRDVDESRELGYTYAASANPFPDRLAALPEDEASPQPNVAQESPFKLVSRSLAALKGKSISITNQVQTISLSPLDSTTAALLAAHARELMAPPDAKPSLPTTTLVVKVAVAQEIPTGAIYRLYLHASANRFSEEKAAAIGVVALFGGHEHHGAEFSFPLAEAFQALSRIGLKPSDPLSLTIVPVGPEKDGRPLPVSDKAKVEFRDLRIEEITLTKE